MLGTVTSSKLIHTRCFWWVFPSSWVINYSVWSWYRWNMSAGVKPDLWYGARQKLKSHVTFSIHASEKVLSVIPMVTRCYFLSQRKHRARWNVTCIVTAQSNCVTEYECFQCNSNSVSSPGVRHERKSVEWHTSEEKGFQSVSNWCFISFNSGTLRHRGILRFWFNRHFLRGKSINCLLNGFIDRKIKNIKGITLQGMLVNLCKKVATHFLQTTQTC